MSIQISQWNHKNYLNVSPLKYSKIQVKIFERYIELSPKGAIKIVLKLFNIIQLFVPFEIYGVKSKTNWQDKDNIQRIPKNGVKIFIWNLKPPILQVFPAPSQTHLNWPKNLLNSLKPTCFNWNWILKLLIWLFGDQIHSPTSPAM